MRLVSTYLFIITFLISCNGSINNEVIVNIEKDIFISGEDVSFQICVEHLKSSLPEYFIIPHNKKDTFRIGSQLHNIENGCAGAKIETKEIGAFQYDGFVKYIDENNNKKLSKFRINFEVIE